MIYHYTTIETFYSMLAKYKSSEDKDNLIFWASNVLNQNDSREMSLRLNDIINTVKEIEKNKPELTELKKLSTIKDFEWLFGHSSENIEKKINSYCTDINYTPYTISFSYQSDKLLMWAMYANNGTGLCLAFDESKIKQEQTDLHLIADKVFYNNNPQIYYKVVSAIYDKYIEESKIIFFNNLENKKGQFLAAMLSGIAPFIKNKAFEDEQEYRLAFYKKEDNKPETYTRLTNRMNVINYVEIRIPISALKQIIIGPCANYLKVRKLLIDNLKSCNIERYFRRFVKKSEVPYRAY